MSDDDYSDLLMDLGPGFSKAVCSEGHNVSQPAQTVMLPPPPAGFRPLANTCPTLDTTAALNSPDFVDLTSEPDEDDARSPVRRTPNYQRNISPQRNLSNSNVWTIPVEILGNVDTSDGINTAAAEIAASLPEHAACEDEVSRQLENMVSLLSSEDDTPGDRSPARRVTCPGSTFNPGTSAAAPSAPHESLHATSTAGYAAQPEEPIEEAIPCPDIQRQSSRRRIPSRQHGVFTGGESMDEEAGEGLAASPKPKRRKKDDEQVALDRAEKAAERQRKAEEKEAAKEAQKSAKEADKLERTRLREEARALRAAEKEAEKMHRGQVKIATRAERGGFAEREIRAVLSTDLAKHPAGHAIMAELAKAELAVDISAHTALAPHRTLRWTRMQAPALTASQGLDCETSEDAPEEVAYVVIYLSAEEFVTLVERQEVRALIRRAAAAHPACTLSLLIEGLNHYLETRERREFRQAAVGASGSSVGTFSRAPSDAALMELVTRYRGVHHRVVMDAPHAAAVLVGITRALAQQPYRTQDMYLETHGGGGPSQAASQLLVSQPLTHPAREHVFRALSHVPNLGPGAAHVIVDSFASLGPLMAAYADTTRTTKQKLDMIARLQKAGGTQRAVGPAAAARLMRLMTATDPDTPLQDAV